MKVHFIAIGGSAMHNLAIALKRKGYEVSGSDDEIFEPSKSKLEKEGLLPSKIGWDVNNINNEIDYVILGMHAREDNPELIQANKLKLKIFSYPEFIFEQGKDKIRIVIGGSHGKTTITSMILHVCKELGLSPDYMVGAQLEGYDCMVKLSNDAKYMILEGDEYLSSPIDKRPKFHLYNPNIAVISGIAWDHINVFPTYEVYIEQFKIFCTKINKDGVLIYNSEDNEVYKLCSNFHNTLKCIPYKTPEYKVINNKCILKYNLKNYEVEFFGKHNIQNMMAAYHVCIEMGISENDFFKSISCFKGAGKRLEKIFEDKKLIIFKDFAHSPSKLKATISAVKENFKDRKILACMELHTFSSLNEKFMPLYNETMKEADYSLVYYNPEVVKHKNLAYFNEKLVRDSFGTNVDVCISKDDILEKLKNNFRDKCVILMMSSGNFDGLDLLKLPSEVI